MTAQHGGAPVLELEDVKRHFPVRTGLFGRSGGAVKAVDGVSLTLKRGETLALVGESGCGKSTLGRMALRLIDPTAGVVRVNGTDLTALSREELRRKRRMMQIVFQDPFASLNPRMSVFDILAEPILLHGLAHGQALTARVHALLGLVGLAPHHAERFPHEFSGGQRQRIGLARAISTNPDLVVCDEPVSALDVSIQAQVVNLLQDLQEKLGLAYLFIAHDLAVVKHIATDVAVMYLGRIVERGPKAALYAAPRHPYTQALLAAAPRPDPALAGAGRVILQGDPPSPLNPPAGCAFHPRCSHAMDRCKAERPLLRPVGPAMVACHLADALPPPPAAQASRATPTVTTRQRILAEARATRTTT
jgi:oligopeptide transport system ATP-binding protein